MSKIQNNYKSLSKDKIVSKALDYTYSSGIYFLIDKEEIVYVGLSITVLKRIKNHYREGGKDFDGVYFLSVPRPMLQEVEEYYIKLFEPKYNIINNPGYIKPLSTKPKTKKEPIKICLDSYALNKLGIKSTEDKKQKQIERENEKIKKILADPKMKEYNFWAIMYKGKIIRLLNYNDVYTTIQKEFHKKIKQPKFLLWLTKNNIQKKDLGWLSLPTRYTSSFMKAREDTISDNKTRISEINFLNVKIK